MPSSLSLTYLPGVNRNEVLASFNVLEIFRKVQKLAHTQTFQVALETLAVLSIFTCITIWAFAVSPSISSL